MQVGRHRTRTVMLELGHDQRGDALQRVHVILAKLVGLERYTKTLLHEGHELHDRHGVEDAERHQFDTIRELARILAGQELLENERLHSFLHFTRLGHGRWLLRHACIRGREAYTERTRWRQRVAYPS